MPEITFEKRELVPEGLVENAKEVNGKWVVDVVPKAKVDEFRENNIALARERDALKATNEKYVKVVGDDIDAFTRTLTDLRSTSQQVLDGKLKTSDEIDRVVSARFKSKEEAYEQQHTEMVNNLNAARARGDEYEGKYKRSIVERAITDAVLATDSGINPQALPDVLARGRAIFRVKDDETLTAMRGDVVYYGADGVSPITPKEWLGKLLQEAPYLGKRNTGGGADGNNSPIAGMNSEEFQKLPAVERIRRYRAAK